MAVYAVVGKLGTGKTKFCVWRAQQALRQGKRVASNVDLFLEHLVPERRAATYQRIPDKPTSWDLDAIGHGNPDSYDEDRNGVLILDELGSWLNSRSFNDKDRLPVIDWMIHARKKGWDVFLIVQNVEMIDKQVRSALVEYTVNCMRLDKVKIPLIGNILQIFGPRAGYLPRFHLATARVGDGKGAVVAERWHYRGDDLHAAYDTRQIFTHRPDDATRTVFHAERFAMTERKGGFFDALRSWFVAARPAPPRRDPLPLVASLMKLPPDERIRRYRALQARGLL